MHTGLMWFDDSDATLEDKLKEIKQRALERLGYEPTECHVGETMIDESSVIVDGIKLVKDANIPHNHFWMGGEDA